MLAVALALVPLPVAASDAKPAPKAKKTIQASMQDMVARDLAKAPARPTARRAEQAGAPTKESVGFFKSKPGMIALAIMVGGVGYALYSAQHDRIKSAGKE